MKPCRTCGRPVTAGGAASRSNARCLICRTAATMRTFRYRPNARYVSEQYEDEARWANRPAETKR